MKFRTEVKIQESPFKLTHDMPIFSSGSCFATNMGKRLKRLKFEISINPFGIVYNPISLSKQHSYILNKETPVKDRLLIHNERVLHYDFHSEINASSVEEWNYKIEQINAAAFENLSSSKVIIWTLGTSIAYRHSDGEIVANCHKQAADLFSKEMLSISENYKHLSRLIKTLGPGKKIILTVSPVRHTKEGLVHNMRSKARLIELANQLAADFEQVDYFPAFEIMMDDLRDYRFYTSDFIHPSEIALDYIWERFETRYFSDETSILNKHLEALNQAVQHRPFNKGGAAFKTFCLKQIAIIESLKMKHSSLEFENELDHFRSYL